MCIGSTFEKDIKELDPRKSIKVFRHTRELLHRAYERERKLQKEYLRPRLVLGTELSAKNKI
jgi:hypothetical protein